jgi:penicillin-binding protein-related factor A (putative recombinase)
MDKDYLIQFNTDGKRLNTYANGVHYQIIEPQPIIETKIDKETGEAIEEVIGYTDEEILNLVDSFDYQTVIDNGGVWFGQDDYNKLIGNANKEYIYKDGQIVEKPPEPIDIEALKTAKIAEMKAERDNREVQDIEYNGKMFDYDDKSRERLTLSRQALEDNKTESILWTCADNTFATLTLEDFKAINTLSATRSTQLHEQYNKLKLLINSLETEEQIKEVTFDTDTSTITLNTGN